MSINLLDLVKGAVGSQMGPLSGILGESEQATNQAIGAAVPAILGGLLKKTSTADGANEVFKTLDDHDGGILDNLGGLLGGGNHTGLLSKGTSLLGMLFGSNHSSLLGTIAKVAGIGQGKVGTLLGVLAPIVMGVLGKQRRTQGLDASGIASLMSAQKDHLGGQIPGELSSVLGIGNLLGGATDAIQGVGSAASQGVHTAGNAAGQAIGDAGRAVGDAGRATAQAAGDAGKAGAGFLWSLVPLLILGALGYFAFTMFNGGGNKDAGTEENIDVNVETGGALPSLDGVAGLPKIDLPGFDAGKINQTFGDLTTGLSGITADSSEESIRGLIPKFEAAGSMVEGLNLGSVADGPQKEAVTSMMGGLVGKLKAVIETAYKIPGVKALLGPTVEGFLQKFSALRL